MQAGHLTIQSVDDPRANCESLLSLVDRLKLAGNRTTDSRILFPDSLDVFSLPGRVGLCPYRKFAVFRILFSMDGLGAG